MENRDRCRRCDAGRMRRWPELTDEQQEVVKRLPASADYSLTDRQNRHRWCTSCWYEETTGSPTMA